MSENKTQEQKFKEELASLLKKYNVSIYADTDTWTSDTTIEFSTPCVGDKNLDVNFTICTNWVTYEDLEVK